jgi:hypothetical protein
MRHTYPVFEAGAEQAVAQRVAPRQHAARVLLEVEGLELLQIRPELSNR